MRAASALGVTMLSLALVLPFAAPDARAQARTTAIYAVVLGTADSTAKRPPGTVPVALRSKTLYWRKVNSGIATVYQFCLGFYETRAEADRARRQLAGSFRAAHVIPVHPLERDNLLKPRPAPEPPPPAPVAAAPAPPALTGGPEALMAQGRGAITREDYRAAIGAFTALLALPENSQTRDAREFLALSYERAGDTTRAKLEYERYLERYPEGEDSARVRQRLANLRPAPPRPALHAPAQTDGRSRTLAYGSLSQFYYRGKSKIDSETLQPVTNTFERTTLSLTDQSALYTDVNLNARFLDETHDSRLVFRDTNTQNYVEGQSDRNRVNAAYYEYRYKPTDFSARLGRQPGYGGGVLGRFDGALFGYGLTSRVRLSLVGGEPVDYGASIDSTRRFYGVSADLGPYVRNWTANLYRFRQTVDGIVDRDAVGTELRYIASKGSVFAQIDYDTAFRHVNIGTLQGNWLAPWRTSFNFLLDYRMSPSLQTSTAVFGEATTSIRTLLETYSEDELRKRARALTARTAFASAGVTHPVSKVWQLGADFRVARISHTDGTNNVPATPGSGYIYTPGVQAIGSGLFVQHDVNAFSFTRVKAPSYAGTAYGVNNRTPVGANWTLGGSLLLYKQDNDSGSELRRVFASVRGEYRIKPSVTLEVEVGADDTSNESALAKDKFNRRYFSLGYRWDF